jgi:hypothetical protein
MNWSELVIKLQRATYFPVDNHETRLINGFAAPAQTVTQLTSERARKRRPRTLRARIANAIWCVRSSLDRDARGFCAAILQTACERSIFVVAPRISRHMVRVLMRDASTAQHVRPREKEHNVPFRSVMREKEHNVPFRLVLRRLAIAFVNETLHRLRVYLRPRVVDLEQQLDRTRDRAFATEPTTQRDRLHAKEPRKVPVGRHRAAAPTATVINDELEPCGRHRVFPTLRLCNVTVQ